MSENEIARHEASNHYNEFKYPCILCSSMNTVKHHEDYNKPLNVLWLCRTCHGQYHNNVLKPIHMKRIKTLYNWFYIRKWIAYAWYIKNKAVYFQRSQKKLSINTFSDPT